MAPWDLQQTLSEATSDVHSFCFSHGHGWAATADYADEAIPYSTSSWAAETTLTEAPTYLTDIDISPDGQWLVYGTNGATAHVHSVGGSWSLETSITDPGSGRTHVQFSRDSNWLAVASSDNNVYIYDVSGGFSLEQTLDDASAARYGLTWDEDTSLLAVGGDSGTYRIYNVGNDWSVTQSGSRSASVLRGMCFSRDSGSQYLAIADNAPQCTIYNTDDWSITTTLSNLTNRATGVDFAYDNQWLAIGSEDSNVYVYDVTEGFSSVTTLTNAGGNVGYYATGVEFSPDGWLGYGSWDDNSYIHEAPVSESVTPVAVSGSTSGTGTVDATLTDVQLDLVPVSGTVQLADGTLPEGATVRGINDTTESEEAVVTTDADGNYTVEFPAGDEAHFLFEYDDGETQYQAESQPFIVPSETPRYIEEKGVFWLPTDEGEGTTTADALENGHDATLHSGPPDWVSGDWVGGYALEYNGHSDATSVPHHEDLNMGSGDLTVALTLGAPAPGTNARGLAIKYPIGGTSTPLYGFYLRSPDNNTVRFRVRDDTGTRAQVDVTITGGYPARLVGVRNGDTFTVYLNGTEIGRETAAVGNTDNTHPFNIGRYWNQPSYEGILDDVLVCDEALTPSEITEDYERQPWS